MHLIHSDAGLTCFKIKFLNCLHYLIYVDGSGRRKTAWRNSAILCHQDWGSPGKVHCCTYR